MVEDASRLEGTREETSTEEADRSRPRKRRKRPGYVLHYFGVVHPLLALGIELSAGFCVSAGFDPLPTVWHVLLVAMVPASNLLAWAFLRNRLDTDVRVVAACLTFALGVSFCYIVVFLPILPIALVFLLVGLLPLAPLLSFVVGVRLLIHLKVRAGDIGGRLLPGMAAGLVAFVLVAVALHGPEALTLYGMRLAEKGKTKAERSFAVELLRAAGDEDAMLAGCYGHRSRGLGMVVPCIFSSNLFPDSKRAREIYYRVTSVPFNAVPPPWIGTREPLLMERWIPLPEQGGRTVAGRVEGLSLSASRIDVTEDADAALAYVEWTMFFKNDSPDQQEARCLVALPPGSVVSRVTLCADGDKSEAAFAARAKVRDAYERVVQAKRDPLLVTVAGPDEILLQCFPVRGYGGKMEVKLGITVPLILEKRDRVTLTLPSFIERNFDVPEEMGHLVWIEARRELKSSNPRLSPEKLESGLYGLRGVIPDGELAPPATVVRAAISSKVTTVWCRDIGGTAGGRVVQTIKEVQGFVPDTVILVVDGSLSMQRYKKDLLEALSAFPKDIRLGMVIAGDDVTEPTFRPEPSDTRLITRIKDGLSAFRFKGGRDNAAALVRAWDLAATSKSGAILWIHGPQPVSFQSTERLAQRFETRPGGPTLFNLAVEVGPDTIGERLATVRPIESVPRLGALKSDLERLFSRWRNHGRVVRAVRERVFGGVTQGNTDSKETYDHLARLWAFDRIRSLEAAGDPDSSIQAAALAEKYRLVTRKTGAVVLEKLRDYEAAQIKPPKSIWGSGTPEPETWALIVVSLLVLLWAICGRRPACVRG